MGIDQSRQSLWPFLLFDYMKKDHDAGLVQNSSNYLYIYSIFDKTKKGSDFKGTYHYLKFLCHHYEELFNEDGFKLDHIKVLESLKFPVATGLLDDLSDALYVIYENKRYG